VGAVSRHSLRLGTVSCVYHGHRGDYAHHEAGLEKHSLSCPRCTDFQLHEIVLSCPGHSQSSSHSTTWAQYSNTRFIKQAPGHSYHATAGGAHSIPASNRQWAPPSPSASMPNGSEG
jgi:hypothetical protein